MMKNEKQLWEACTEGNLSLVKELCRDRAINVNWGDPEAHRTVLYRACGHGKVAVVKELPAHPKIDPNIPQKDHATPLYIACRDGHAEVVKVLLGDDRVDVNLPDREKCTPIIHVMSARSCGSGGAASGPPQSGRQQS